MDNHQSRETSELKQEAEANVERLRKQAAGRVCWQTRDEWKAVYEQVEDYYTAELEQAMGIKLYLKSLTLTESRCYQPLREPIVAKCCQSGGQVIMCRHLSWIACLSAKETIRHLW